MSVLQYVYSNSPVFANSLAGFVCFGLGDVISQQRGQHCFTKAVDENPYVIDFARSAKIGCLGIATQGVGYTIWYRLLDRVFGAQLASMSSVAKKCIVDQLVASPVVDSSFLAFAVLIKPCSKLADAFANVEEKFWTVWVNDCKFWPSMNLIAFRFVPTQYRPTFIGFCSVGWQIYISNAAHEPTSWEARPKEADAQAFRNENGFEVGRTVSKPSNLT